MRKFYFCNGFESGRTKKDGLFVKSIITFKHPLEGCLFQGSSYLFPSVPPLFFYRKRKGAPWHQKLCPRHFFHLHLWAWPQINLCHSGWSSLTLSCLTESHSGCWHKLRKSHCVDEQGRKQKLLLYWDCSSSCKRNANSALPTTLEKPIFPLSNIPQHTVSTTKFVPPREGRSWEKVQKRILP